MSGKLNQSQDKHSYQNRIIIIVITQAAAKDRGPFKTELSQKKIKTDRLVLFSVVLMNDSGKNQVVQLLFNFDFAVKKKLFSN